MTEIVASVLGGLVGGLFTFLGVLITIHHENKKTRKEELRRQKEKDEVQFKDRPRFDIVRYKDLTTYPESKKADISLLFCMIKSFKNEGRAMFYYDQGVIEPKNWVAVEYVLKNIGNTEISHMFFSTNLPKNTAIFGIDSKQYEMCYKNNFLNYSVILDKTVKPKETIKLKVCYISEQVVVSNMGNAPITVWLVDENNNWWSQSLFAPESKIYDAKRTSYYEWSSYTDESVAIKCFENPMLW